MISKKELKQLFDSFNQMNVLIIGDVMVDSYLWGNVNRISPEAPVPIVSVKNRENRLGGAANVGLNIKSMGANPILCSVVGNDVKGQEFLELLTKEELSTEGIIKSNDRITTTKFRVIGNKMQLLRVDEEDDSLISDQDSSKLIEKFRKIIKGKKIDVIVFQDYDKGVISPDLIKTITELARKNNIPVTVDPKKRNFCFYSNVTLFKPNLKELNEGLNIIVDPKSKSELVDAVKQLKLQQSADIVMITLSEEGIFVDYNSNGEKGIKILPSQVRSIADVSGAGDTVISVASLCIAAKLDPVSMADISNRAGGLVCEEAGVVPVNRDVLFQKLKSLLND
jgi:rfaE bifunctional protein kinase chain/domain